ncbi:acyltransferase [Haloglomus litoreum]|uniref:acyltransferase n=1 Tax=Haloglomus litoreum TaxID=3034026 RepID=UPI0023E88728|nr:acyltransferase [Haloglomus sp. DT116]
MTKRHVELPPEVQTRIDEAVAFADHRLASDDPTGAVVGELLAEIHGDRQAYERYLDGKPQSPMARVRAASYDPRNALTESEHWAEQDHADLREAKCLNYLWRGFDESPLANNTAFALPFRRMLATHLFEEVGEGVRLFGGIKIQCGHNIVMGDNVVVHNDVLLDDRGELVIGDRVSIADRSHLHTHSHDVVDQSDVTNYRTVVDDDARLGYDSMVNAGCRVGVNAMVGAGAMVRGDVPDHHVAVGSPAESVKVKPGWEPVAREPGPLENRAVERQLDSDLTGEFESVDEFGRDLTPPARPGSPSD